MSFDSTSLNNGTADQAPFTRATLTQQCYLEIKRRILIGDLQPGERLNEKQLAATLRVSPTPVREALNKLRSDGLVTYSAWQGAAVIDLNANDLAYLYDIRCVLEGLAIREACPKIAAEDLDHLDTLLAQAATVMAGSDPEAENIHESNHVFHQFILERSGNPWLVRMMEGIQDLQALARRFLPALESGKEAHSEHISIMAALRAGDCASAEGIMVSHIERIKAELLSRAEKASADGAVPVGEK